jgi:hypothetical protein
VSLNIGDVDDVVCINNEAINGTVYNPTGDCGETSTLNNGGRILWVDTLTPLEMKSVPFSKLILVTLLEKGVSISAGISCFSPCLMTIFSGCVNMSMVGGRNSNPSCKISNFT